MEIYHEQPELSLSRQDLVIYPNQGWLVVFTLLIGLGLVLCSSVLIVFCFFFLRSVASLSYRLMIELMILFVVTIILLSWVLWNLLRALFGRQSALVVTSEGIQAHAMPGSGDFFISWPEIDAISVRFYLGTGYLCIHPKNPKQYLSRFKALKRLWMGSYKLIGLPPLAVTLIFLDMPVAAFFQQMSQRYARQLSEEHIRLLP